MVIDVIYRFQCDECGVCAPNNSLNQGLISTEFDQVAEQRVSQAEGNPPAGIFTP